MLREVKAERTGWRDGAISERHRSWGFDCPAVDIDFLVVEYDAGRPAALVEYKHERARPQYPSSPSIRAIVALGDGSGIPVFGVRYADDFSRWRAIGLNDAGRAYVPDFTEFSEEGWVRLLYHVRGKDMPAGLFDRSRQAI